MATGEYISDDFEAWEEGVEGTTELADALTKPAHRPSRLTINPAVSSHACKHAAQVEVFHQQAVATHGCPRSVVSPPSRSPSSPVQPDDTILNRFEGILADLKLQEVRLRAKVIGVEPDRIDDAEDSDSPRDELVALVLQQLQGLLVRPFKGIKAVALAAGLPDVAIEEALGEQEGRQERKAAIAELILQSALGGSTNTMPHKGVDWQAVLEDCDQSRQLAHLQAASEQWSARRWVLKRRLGQGGGGIVFLAVDQRLGPVALKFSCGEREREAALLQRVSHPHICRLFEYGSIVDGIGSNGKNGNGALFGMCLDYLDGGSLEELSHGEYDTRCNFLCICISVCLFEFNVVSCSSFYNHHHYHYHCRHVVVSSPPPSSSPSSASSTSSSPSSSPSPRSSSQPLHFGA